MCRCWLKCTVCSCRLVCSAGKSCVKANPTSLKCETCTRKLGLSSQESRKSVTKASISSGNQNEIAAAFGSLSLAPSVSSQSSDGSTSTHTAVQGQSGTLDAGVSPSMAVSCYASSIVTNPFADPYEDWKEQEIDKAAREATEYADTLAC